MEQEPKTKGSIWKHPYLLYVLGTVAIFVFLLLIGWLAIQNDWLPKR